MAQTEEKLTVTRDDDRNRYEIFVDDSLGGFTTFHTDSRGRVVYPETEIDPAFKGRGLGSKLIGKAMTESAERGETVVPECSFVAHYLKKNQVPGLKVDWPEPADDD